MATYPATRFRRDGTSKQIQSASEERMPEWMPSMGYFVVIDEVNKAQAPVPPEPVVSAPEPAPLPDVEPPVVKRGPGRPRKVAW